MRNSKAVEDAEAPDEVLLQDEELEKLYNATDFNQCLQSQRYNMIVFGFRTGLRPDSVMSLFVNMFRHITTEEGVEGLQVHIGTMKNLPATLGKIDSALYKQTITRASDARCVTTIGTT